MTRWIAALALLVSCAAPVHAKTSTVSFDGYVSGDLPRPGDHFSGTITYDLGTLPDDVFGGDGYTVGQYDNIASIEGMLGAFHFATGAITLISDQFAGDESDRVGFIAYYDGLTQAFFDFRAPSANSFSGIAAPQSLHGYTGSVSLSNNRDQSASGDLTVSAPVPEPAEWLLMLAGMAMAIRFGLARRSAAAGLPRRRRDHGALAWGGGIPAG